MAMQFAPDTNHGTVRKYISRRPGVAAGAEHALQPPLPLASQP